MFFEVWECIILVDACNALHLLLRACDFEHERTSVLRFMLAFPLPVSIPLSSLLLSVVSYFGYFEDSFSRTWLVHAVATSIVSGNGWEELTLSCTTRDTMAMSMREYVRMM